MSRCSPRRSRSVIKVFARLFQKAAQSRAKTAQAVQWAILLRCAFFVAPRKARNKSTASSFLPSFFLCAFGTKEKSGHWKKLDFTYRKRLYFPFVIKAILSAFRFSFDTRGAKEKLTKENAAGYFARCDGRPTLRALDQRSLFEKSDVKTFKSFALNSPINCNLSTIRSNIFYRYSALQGRGFLLYGNRSSKARRSILRH